MSAGPSTLCTDPAGLGKRGCELLHGRIAGSCVPGTLKKLCCLCVGLAVGLGCLAGWERGGGCWGAWVGGAGGKAGWTWASEHDDVTGLQWPLALRGWTECAKFQQSRRGSGKAQTSAERLPLPRPRTRNLDRPSRSLGHSPLTVLSSLPSDYSGSGGRSGGNSYGSGGSSYNPGSHGGYGGGSGGGSSYQGKQGGLGAAGSTEWGALNSEPAGATRIP